MGAPSLYLYGYRYVKVEGNTQPLEKADYQAAVLYSDMTTTGAIKTANKKSTDSSKIFCGDKK